MFMNSEFSLFIVLYVLLHKIPNLYTLIFTFPAVSNKPT